MEHQIDLSNLETFLDSAEAILMQKMKEANLNPETQFDLEYFEITILRNQVKELILKYVKKPESDQWVFELLKRKAYKFELLKIEELCQKLNALELNKWLGLQETILDLRSNTNKQILEKLRGKSYYTNPQNIQNDLNAFAQKIGVQIIELNCFTMESIEITATNGENIQGITYLKNAARALDLSSNDKEDRGKQTEALKALFKIGGFKVEEYLPRDKVYYTNPKNVLFDLKAFATKIGVQVSKLQTKKMESIEIICANKEKVKGQTYIQNASSALGLSSVDEKGKKKNKRKDALQELMKIAGIKLKEYPARDKTYYENPDNVLYDLQAIARKAKVKIIELNMGNILSLDIKCKNGEKVKAITYLRNAARALGLSKNRTEDAQNQKNALQALLKIAGF